MSSAEAGEASRKNRIFCPLLLQEFWGKVWNRANISLPLFSRPASAFWDVDIWEEADGFMSVEIGRQRKQQRALAEARAHLDCAADLLHYALLSSDLLYATQEMEWQEGPAGMQHVQSAQGLREAEQKLRLFELPEVGKSG